MKKYNVKVNGVLYEVEIEETYEGRTETVAAPAASAVPAAPVAPAPKAAPAAPAAAPTPKASSASGNTEIKAPMPGTLLKINVSEGASVSKGDVLCILEAMKMENEICAPSDGKVVSIVAKQGDQLNSGDVMITLDV